MKAMPEQKPTRLPEKVTSSTPAVSLEKTGRVTKSSTTKKTTSNPKSSRMTANAKANDSGHCPPCSGSDRIVTGSPKQRCQQQPASGKMGAASSGIVHGGQIRNLLNPGPITLAPFDAPLVPPVAFHRFHPNTTQAVVNPIAGIGRRSVAAALSKHFKLIIVRSRRKKAQATRAAQDTAQLDSRVPDAQTAPKSFPPMPSLMNTGEGSHSAVLDKIKARWLKVAEIEKARALHLNKIIEGLQSTIKRQVEAQVEKRHTRTGSVMEQATKLNILQLQLIDLKKALRDCITRYRLALSLAHPTEDAMQRLDELHKQLLNMTVLSKQATLTTSRTKSIPSMESGTQPTAPNAADPRHMLPGVGAGHKDKGNEEEHPFDRLKRESRKPTFEETASRTLKELTRVAAPGTLTHLIARNLIRQILMGALASPRPTVLPDHSVMSRRGTLRSS